MKLKRISGALKIATIVAGIAYAVFTNNSHCQNAALASVETAKANRTEIATVYNSRTKEKEEFYIFNDSIHLGSPVQNLEKIADEFTFDPCQVLSNQNKIQEKLLDVNRAYAGVLQNNYSLENGFPNPCNIDYQLSVNENGKLELILKNYETNTELKVTKAIFEK